MAGKKKSYAVLLRGVTPSGKNKVPMAGLREALAQTPLGEVSTYIQSGNVLVRSELPPTRIEKIVHDAIAENFGGDLAIMALTGDELQALLDRNPFAGEETSRMYFTVLSEMPKQDRIEQFAVTDFSPDRIQIIGRMVYSLYATKHSDSKFNNNVFERMLKVSATTRNWNTMTALIKRCAEL